MPGSTSDHDSAHNTESAGASQADSVDCIYAIVSRLTMVLCRALGVRDPHHATEDVAQDVCLKLVRLGQFDRLRTRLETGQPVRPFLRTCVLNTIRDSIRRAAREPDLESDILNLDSGLEEHFISTAAADDIVDLHDSIDMLRSACSSAGEARMFAVLDDHVGTGATIVDACRGHMSPSMFRHVRSQFRKKPKVRRILRDCA